MHVWSGLQDVKFGELIFEEIKTRFFHLNHWAGFPVVHRPTRSVKKTCWYPKVCVMAHETALLGVGAWVRWSETGMSTRL